MKNYMLLFMLCASQALMAQQYSIQLKFQVNSQAIPLKNNLKVYYIDTLQHQLAEAPVKGNRFQVNRSWLAHKPLKIVLVVGEHMVKYNWQSELPSGNLEWQVALTNCVTGASDGCQFRVDHTFTVLQTPTDENSMAKRVVASDAEVKLPPGTQLTDSYVHYETLAQYTQHLRGKLAMYVERYALLN